MKVLLIGSGGREHALACSLAASPQLSELHIAPGNAGMQAWQRLDIGAQELDNLLIQATREQYDLVVIGPEAPLAAGLVDKLNEAGLLAFGPTQACAQLEASKAFAKALMQEAGIPTAAYQHCLSQQEALEALAAFSPPYVVKEDGLAAGKGVTVTLERSEAEAAIQRAFAKAGSVVLESFLEGQELSVLALCDGKQALPLVSAQDFKRVGEGQTGPNTGGMGAYAPVPFVSPTLMERIQQEVLQPVLEVFNKRGTPYRGVLYAGLMINAAGAPSVVEFNCRFGDPETQVVLPLLQADLLPLLKAAAEGDLSPYAQQPLTLPSRHAVTVVLAAEGYPGDYPKDLPIGLPTAWPAHLQGHVQVFHAGTRLSPEQTLLSSGGRIVNVSATGESLAQARERAYEAIALLDAPGCFYRRDIAELAVASA
jgi:phosphoribosylamine--glycine ligase